jgi:type I restriction enzyme S subunit
MSSPKIRFKGFTDDWEQRKFGDLTIRESKCDISSVDLPSVEYEDVIVEEGLLNKDISLKEVQKKGIVFDGSQVLYGKLRPYLHNWLNPDFMGVAVGDWWVLRPIEMNKNFIYRLIQTKQFDDVANQSAGSKMPRADWNLISETEFMVPCSSEEQAKIGDYFSILDHLITLHQRKCEETKKLKKFMLQKMFPQNGECVPEIRFSGYTDAWEQRKLGDVIDVCSGRDYKHLDEGEIPVYGTGGYMLSVSEALSDKYDAIGIGRKGTIDNPYILRAPFWTVDTLFYCIPKEEHDLDFLFGIYQNINWKAMDESTGVPSLSKTAINNVDVMIPAKTEQKKIGIYFATLDHLITLHQRKCEELQNIKKFMLQNMFV